MNLFYELFYKHYVEGLLFPLPVKYWQVFNESLSAFPIIELSSKYPASSRRTKKIQLIVLHHTGSNNISNALKWFKNPNNYASTHFIVDRDGHIQQLVKEEDSSFHIQNAVYKHSRLVAESSLGLHLVGNGVDNFTDAQYEAVAMLCAHLQKKYGLTNEEILKHSEVEVTNLAVPANDPTPWDQEKFLGLVEIFKNV
jgi:N-acetyl-anhydromuramyl-L-alanine amidase AmpD